MKFNFEGMDKIGEGEEKEVYVHPEREDAVTARFKEGRAHSERSMRGRFYLTKILHVLFPTQIPDVSLSAKGEDVVLVSQRKELDEEHKTHSKLRMQYRNNPNPSRKDKKEYEESLQKQHEKLAYDDKYIDLSGDILALGIRVDMSPSNFGYDKENHLLYVDNDFEPWRIKVNQEQMKGHMVKNYDREKIISVIDGLKTEVKERIVSYLDRLDALFEEEKEEKGYL